VLRLFIGAELPPDCRKELALIKPKSDKKAAKTKWVAAENMHITIKFLGGCDDDVPDKIISALADAVSNFESFCFRLGELGGFPSLKKANIFWMGLAEGSEEMSDLAALVEKGLMPLGFEKERRQFHPHVTLARLKRPQDLQEIALNQELDKPRGNLIKVEYVTLYKSTLTPNGAIYDVLERVPLK